MHLPALHTNFRGGKCLTYIGREGSVRVPTEGTVATTHVVLEIPAGVMVLEVLPPDGATFETRREGDRITAITWKKEIPPKAVAEFVFRAHNPSSGDIVWKAHQHFSDGTTTDWIGVAGEKRPASVTKLAAAARARAAQVAENGVAAPATWLMSSDMAFRAKNLDNVEDQPQGLELFVELPGAGAGPRRVPGAKRLVFVARIT